jgi:hypothetical protein
MREWMEPHAVDLVCEIVNREMEDTKPSLKMYTTEVTPEFIERWDINTTMDPVAKKTAVFPRVINAATESPASQAKSKSSKSRN